MKEKGAVIADNYCHYIYRCPQCGEFYGRFFIHLDYENGSFEVVYKCSKCKATLKPVDYEISPEDRYTDMGLVDYFSHQGSKPLNITWRQHQPNWANSLKKTN